MVRISKPRSTRVGAKLEYSIKKRYKANSIHNVEAEHDLFLYQGEPHIYVRERVPTKIRNRRHLAVAVSWKAYVCSVPMPQSVTVDARAEEGQAQAKHWAAGRARLLRVAAAGRRPFVDGEIIFGSHAAHTQQIWLRNCGRRGRCPERHGACGVWVGLARQACWHQAACSSSLATQNRSCLGAVLTLALPSHAIGPATVKERRTYTARPVSGARQGRQSPLQRCGWAIGSASLY
jgi:hypothetical protein